MNSIRAQVHRNAVALISLVIASGSLGYNTWRNETTEHQRNLRHASFRVLERLGELQEVADYRHYYLPFGEMAESEGQLRLRGYGSVALIRDLMTLMPEPAPAAGRQLHETWHAAVNTLGELDPGGTHTERAKRRERELTGAINDTREAVVSVLKSLE